MNWNGTQVVQRLPSNCEGMGSIHLTTKKKKKDVYIKWVVEILPMKFKALSSNTQYSKTSKKPKNYIKQSI
jgi:hypothetical protein